MNNITKQSQPLERISASWYRPMHHLGLCALPTLWHSSFLAYTPNWPVALFLLLFHLPGTLYLLTFDCAKTFSLLNPTWKPIYSNFLVLLCCIKRLCTFGPKGVIQIRYYYYYYYYYYSELPYILAQYYAAFWLLIFRLSSKPWSELQCNVTVWVLNMNFL